MAAASGTVSLNTSQTNSADAYDHPINLVDATKPKLGSTRNPSDDVLESSGASLTRKWTKNTLRKELAKRKYAKWQRGKGHVPEESEQIDTNIGPNTEGVAQSFLASDQTENAQESPTDQQCKKPAAVTKEDRHSPEQGQDQDSFIDVLYENQRGWFLFGMPLYSANSLLNLDPAPWQNSMFQDSPVNITNAQVPDPSWQWAWKTWYVDMSHDVDEEGWEYSFSFQSRFAWHGSHPWFHSFARRRRWLRKRIKVRAFKHVAKRGTMKESHRLNADYFTIHGAGRDRSPESSAEGTLANRSSYTGYDGNESDEDEDLNDIPNVIALLAILKKASVDREKVVAVRTFLGQGEDELHYLADNMDEIMGLLIYQTSRQQLFEYLSQALASAQSNQIFDSKSIGSDHHALERKIDNLSKAMDAARTYLSRLDYWTDATEAEKLGKSRLTIPPAFGKDNMDWPEETRAHIEEANTDNRIRGIPKEADVDTAPSLLRTAQEQAESAAGGPVDKGKGRQQD
ncbi:MAG: hypothetical protein Q9170_004714 [Blastenia crenularia]